MTQASFYQRLRSAMESGSLTPSDLARWFDRPYSTVSKWLAEQREPWGPNGERAYHQLTRLEQLIRKRRGFPIPVDLSPTDRVTHLEGVKRDAGVLELDPPR